MSGKPTSSRLMEWRKEKEAEWRLHPLIHTVLESTLAQDVEKKKSGIEDSALFSQLKPRYCSLVLRGKVGIKV